MTQHYPYLSGGGLSRGGGESGGLHLKRAQVGSSTMASADTEVAGL